MHALHGESCYVYALHVASGYGDALHLLLDVNLVCRVVAAWHFGYVRVSCRVNGVVAAASAGMWTCVWMSRASHKDPLCC
jgi:hypothetical protein